MADPTPAELAAMIKQLSTNMTEMQKQLSTSINTMQQQIGALQLAQHPSSSAGSGGLGHPNTDRPPRFQKLDFPKFDGKSDPLAFINRCESYFVQQRIAAEEQVWMASYNLEDTAQMWYILVQQSEGTPNWRRFTELLNLRFGPPLRSNPMGELMVCKRTSSVAEYQARFEALLPRAGPLEEEQRIQAFTAGLQPPLSHDVEMHNPQTLIIAMSLARKLEIREQSVASAVACACGPGTAFVGQWPAGRAAAAARPSSPASAAEPHHCHAVFRGPPGPPALLDGDGRPPTAGPLFQLQ